MLYTKKFVFTVSLCAMLAVNPVLAVTNPVEAKAGAFSGEVGKAGTVYSDWAGRAESGIAGVAYVNGAVDAAGNAAQWAENHAAAAAQSAKSAADSAAQAASKVSIDQGADKKNLAMVTDDKGSVYPGYVSEGMIGHGAVTTDKISTDGALPGQALTFVSDSSGSYVTWGQIGSESIAPGAVTFDKIAYDSVKSNNISSGAVTWDKIAYDAVSTHNISGLAVTAEKMSASGQAAGVVLVADGNDGAKWGQVGNAGIASGAVTEDKMNSDWEAAGVALVADGNNGAKWGAVETTGIANSAVTTVKIADGAVTTDRIADGAVRTEKIASSYSGKLSMEVADNGLALVADGDGGAKWGQIGLDGIADRAVAEDKIFASGRAAGVALVADGNNGAEWGQVGTEGIADGAVKREKTEGIVGVIPVGSATDPTSYGSFWIE